MFVGQLTPEPATTKRGYECMCYLIQKERREENTRIGAQGIRSLIWRYIPIPGSRVEKTGGRKEAA